MKNVLIIGGGPAGLTLAYEILTNPQTKHLHPIVLEATDKIGGISQTANFDGNRIDIGGHRFFSKSDEVMAWWNNILPVEKTPESEAFLAKYPNTAAQDNPDATNPEKTDDVMLVRNRLSRIYYGRKFYDYPVSLSMKTLTNLGFIKTIKIGFSYIATKFHKVPEEYLEGFYVNRFGRELYNTFFRDYTEKLWGISPDKIDSSWGAQRVKGLSLRAVLANALSPNKAADLTDKNVETSLIEAFLYPKLGPGHLWETVAKKIEELGGEVRLDSRVTQISETSAKTDTFNDINLNEIGADGSSSIKRLSSVKLADGENINGEYVVSTLPVNELIHSMKSGGVHVPENISKVADGLPFRDFITVGILADELKVKNETTHKTVNNIIPDNWIYIQEPDVKVCRLQIFNNWSPYLIAPENKNKTWIGMEYVVSEKDDIWKLSEQEMSDYAIKELEKIGILDHNKVAHTHVLHMKKTYPAYFGTYPDFEKVKEYTLEFENLFLIGRNGQHRYNNMDHSMLTAIRASEIIAKAEKALMKTDENYEEDSFTEILFNKKSVWEVNTEQEYHENK
ncbi:MAG: NAD(P)/FAD-dependent oxidoreductase [Bifidobacteriaceae bacterium]|jgi:protoporphyrinogen oxidase|nr:NAD(P)/FAD-dependent oxidoreductase [Bifidobacteriaceae bacterium]